MLRLPFFQGTDRMMRTVLVTGGSRGIGAATVRRFAQAGDRVFFTYLRSEAAATRLAAETGATAIRGDAASREDAEAAIREAEKQGPLDVLVCNAGVAHYGMIMDMGDADYRRVMDTNVYGPFAALRAAMPGMFWRRKGCIVTLSSIWGQHGASCEGIYSASKAAVIALTQAAAKEGAAAGVRVNCVAPGAIDTEMNGHLSPEEKKELEAEIPLGRMGTAEEVAEVIFFLCGEGAAYITGQVIPVNGGWGT